MTVLATLMIGLLALIYTLIAAYFLFMTHRERCNTGSGFTSLTVCAYALCLAWPLAIVATLVSVRLRTA